MRSDKLHLGQETLLIIIMHTVLRHALATKLFVGPAYPRCRRVFKFTEYTVNTCL